MTKNMLAWTAAYAPLHLGTPILNVCFPVSDVPPGNLRRWALEDVAVAGRGRAAIAGIARAVGPGAH
jgi:hypothetical protein